ncbi:MAG: hypothetical protein ACLRFJ_01120 [Alphaproteobacteria bacterium]
MKVKNIIFSGVMASILMIGGASAAAIGDTKDYGKVIASESTNLTSESYVQGGVRAAEDWAQEYTDAKITAVNNAAATLGNAVTANADAITKLNGADTVVDSVAYKIKNAVDALDSTKEKTAGSDGLALKIVEVGGKITSIEGSIADETYDEFGAAAAVDAKVTKLNGGVDTAGSVLNSIKTKAGDATYISTNAAEGSVSAAIKANADAIASLTDGENSVDAQITAAVAELDATVTSGTGSTVNITVAEEDGKLTSVSATLKADAVDTTQIKNDAVTLDKIADSAMATIWPTTINTVSTSE